MTLMELQEILGKRIEVITTKNLTKKERLREIEISQSITSVAKQMINNANVILRADRLTFESENADKNIDRLVNGNV